MPEQKITLPLPSHYELRETVHAHGWHQLAPFQWDAKRGILRFALLSHGQAIDVSVRQGRRIEITLTSHRRLSLAAKNAALERVRRSLDLDTNTTDLLEAAQRAGAQYARLVRGGAGRRLRSASLWEDAAKTLFTTNCTWALTLKMCSTACSEKFSPVAPSGTFPFPDAATLTRHDAAELKALLPVGYRAPFLRALATRFASDPELAQLESSQTTLEKAYATILDLDGFGPYATSHLLMMAGHFQHIPVDTVATSFVREAFGARKAESFIKRRYAKWGRYRFWGFRLDQLMHWGKF